MYSTVHSTIIILFPYITMHSTVHITPNTLVFLYHYVLYSPTDVSLKPSMLILSSVSVTVGSTQTGL